MKRFFKNSILLLVVLVVCFACTEEYLTDSGVAKAETDLTVYDYLKQNRYHMFDSLLVLIDTLDLKDEINSCGTFFAPSDYNIQLYLKDRTETLRDFTGVEDTVYTFSTLVKNVQARYLLQYALNEKVTMAIATTAGAEYSTLYNDETMTVQKIQTTDAQYYTYSDSPVYFLYLIKDGKKEEVCQTTDILTENGAGPVLHVLNNTHIFNLFSNAVVE